MVIHGLQKTTLLDYPGHIACTIFFGRCNLRCPFCHNMELVTNPEHFPTFQVDEILKFLNERKGKLNGVAITGGEPLLNKDIGELLKPIKELGYPIKLDTNGFFPEMIEKLIDEDLVDMFAMDIKSGFTNYLKVSGVGASDNVGAKHCEPAMVGSNENVEANACGAHRRGELCEPVDIVGATHREPVVASYASNNWKQKLEKSISLLINRAPDYEFRTTCVKGLHTESDFHEIKEIIKGAKKYFLQNYKAGPGMENLPFKPFLREELERFADIVRDSVGRVDIRGVD